jgi:hypothetical protein
MRCFCCKKKTHIEFKCACGKVYCVGCRLPEVHKCDVKLDVKIVLEKVVTAKVDKI